MSSPITQWRETVKSYLRGAKLTTRAVEIDAAADQITSATIELVESYFKSKLPSNSQSYCETYCTCDVLDDLAELRQSLKELSE